MRKQLLILIFTIFNLSLLVAQVGIGTTSPNPAAILDIQSDSTGLLIPRLSLSGNSDNATIKAPVKGLIVYNTADNGSLSEGFVFYDGTEWTNIGWKLKGNVAGADSFLGTVNDMPLVFKADNTALGELKPNGAISFGLNTFNNSANSFALGSSTTTGGSRSYAIGSGASASSADAFAIGTNAVANRQNTIILGGTNQNIGIGTSDPSAKFHLNGSLRIEDGNQAAGKVLTSDANGNATWQTVSSSGSGSSTSSYGEVYLSSDSTFDLNRYTNLNITNPAAGLSTSDINLVANGIQPKVSGVYKVTYTVTYIKNQNSGASKVIFYLTKNTNKVSNTEVIGNLDRIYETVVVTKILNLEAYQTYWIGISKTNETPDAGPQITIKANMTNLVIEKL